MDRKSALILLLCVFLCAATSVSKETTDLSSLEPFNKADRVLILAPHPDDEVIGCAGVIQEAVSAGAQVRVVYLTNGEHNEFAFIVYEKRIPLRQGEFIHMGQVRRSESIKSMKLLGLNEDRLTFLGYPDYGTFTIFTQYWQTDKPYKTILTRISSVPYKENLSFGAPYVGESVLGDLKNILINYKPNRIFVSHPADVNGDHRSLYLFLQIALSDLKKELPAAKIYPYLVHCVGWPLPRHYHPELSLQPPQKFSSLGWLNLSLSDGQLSKKHEAILMHKSQTRSSAFYLLSFCRRNEIFADYPQIQLKSQDLSGGTPLKFSGFSDLYQNIIEDDSGAIRDCAKSGGGGVSFAIADRSLFVRIEKEGGFAKKSAFVLYLFGYNEKKNFSQMPKIRVFAKNKKIKVFDDRKMLAPAGVSFERNANTIALRVPLSVLGDPDFILASMKGYGGILPVDAIAFRKIVIKQGGGDE